MSCILFNTVELWSSINVSMGLQALLGADYKSTYSKTFQILFILLTYINIHGDPKGPFGQLLTAFDPVFYFWNRETYFHVTRHSFFI